MSLPKNLKLTDLIYLDKPLFYYDGSHGDGRNYWNFLNNLGILEK